MSNQRIRDTLPCSLEVRTNDLHPPTLAILSPTPRAYTFPNHSITDSPFSSPSSSPFEPDLCPLTCTPPPTFINPFLPTAPTSPISPTSPTKSPSPHPCIQNRRKSSTSDIERRPKKGDEDYVKRPENAFILFRRKCCEDRQQAQAEADGVTKKQRQADLSKTISQQWKGLTAEERQYWEELAKEKKKEHEQMYPNYVYRPQRSKDKDGRSKSKKAKGVRGEYEHETDCESLSFVVPYPTGPFTRRHGRSASAPTPPLPYQSFQMPNVYMPSCPTSPSLIPLINRRSSHPNHPHGSMDQFDYLMSPSFGQAGEFDPEFFQNMLMGTHTDPSMLLPQLFSPSSSLDSSSSGTSSPNAGPFTPTAAMLSSSFAHLCGPDFGQQLHDPITDLPQTQADLELQTELQLQQENMCSPYSWANNSIWPAGNDTLRVDDFDLNAIPPIALDLPKFSEDMNVDATQGPADFVQSFVHGVEVAQQYHEDGQSIDGIFGFDEMMSRHSF